MEEFRKQFDNVEFHKGLEITFVQKGNQLVTKVEGEQVGCVCGGSTPRAPLGH